MARTVRTNLVRRERRDPVAATRNPTYRGLDQPQVTEWNADQAFRYGVMANVVAFRCLQVWADAAAKYPFRAGATPPERPGATADHNPNARLAQLLGPPTRRVGNRVSGPNPEMTGRQLMAWTAAQRIATGRNAWEIEWTDAPGRGQVAALWPLPASHLEPIPTAGKAPRYYRGFRYTADPANAVDLKPEQVHYGWTMGGTDVRQPMAPLQASRYAITLAVMGDRQNLAFLKNGAVPAHIITTTEFATDDERKAFRDGWNAQYRGPDNAGKPRFHEVDDQGEGPVGDAIDIKTLGVSNRDSQFVQAHLQSLKEIAWGLGVPWSKIDAADRTFSNAEAEERVWLLERVVPFLETLADEINLRLAPMLGSEVGWFDLSGEEALRPKPRFTASDGVTLWSSGLATAEEVRGELGLDPDVVLPAPPMTPGLAAPDPLALPAGGTNDGRDAQDQHHRETGTPVGDDGQRVPLAPPDPVRSGTPSASGGRDPGLTERRALTPEEQEVRRTTIWRRNDAALRGLEARFAKAWADYFTRQAKAVVGQLTGKRTAVRLAAASQARELRADLGIGGPLDPNEIARWRAAAQDLADLMHTAASTAGVTRVNNAFGVSFDLEAPFVQDFIRARANQLAGQVTDTTYRSIQQALADGVAQGASIDDLAASVQDVFDVASRNRALTIARTEVISASNGSASLAAAQLPADVAAGQEFIATRDERTRDDHSEADGQIVAMGQPFDVGGESLLYPGDPAGSAENVINCRCYPADTLVQAPGVLAGFRRWYEGDLVEITTAGGHQFAGTPNHPVLTGSGWRPLHSLVEGDHVISGRVRDDATGRPDVVDVPTPIGEVVDALALVAATVGTVERVLSSGVDFHGDGQDGTVDVVATGRKLGNRVQATGAQLGVEHVLAVGLEGEVHVPHEQADLIVGHRVDAELLGGRPASALDTFDTQAGGDDLAAGSVLLGESLLADAGPVQGGDLSRVDPVVLHALGDGGGLGVPDRAHESALLEFAAQAGRADVMGPGGHKHVGPFEVGVDRVIDVRVRRFAGHVFNLSTETGTYIAEGIVTHNCTVAFLTPQDMEGRSRVVPLRTARALLRMVPAGTFDEARFRRALLEAA